MAQSDLPGIDWEQDAWVKSLKVGDIVCDCRHVHSKITAIRGQYVSFDNGWGCDAYHCCEPADHPQHWFVYLVRCWKDKSLYCGITTNLMQRIDDHNQLKGSFKGAKYTRGRGPVKLVYSEMVSGKSAALKRECAIKKLSREKKIALIKERKQ
jgi:putative endonuclease